MKDYTDELTSWERDQLSEAASGLYHRPRMRCQAHTRYCFYRRHGHSKADAVRYTLVWCANMIEQQARRLSHETGAENWKMRSPGMDRLTSA